ncbi:MAG TPA: hypothetical protein VF596_03190 [Pyrinomonadaceae bacterium]|jgi:hypothetical protein
MEKLSRRDFFQNSLGSILAFSLVNSLCDAQALTGSVKTIAHKWVIEMEQITKSLRKHKIRQIEWQQQIESLLSEVDLKDLFRAIDYDRLAKTVVFPENHESMEDITFPKIKGLSEELSFNPYFFAMKKDVAIVPHGHQNMTTMHMVLSGEAHGWHYDRIADEPNHLIIKPTSDKLLTAGAVSTISDEKDNIHWFKATTEKVFIFNIGVYILNPKQSYTGRDYIDPVNGEKLKDGLIRARKINQEESYKIYGKS